MSTSPASDLPDREVELRLNAEGYAVPSQDPIKVMRGQQKVKWSAPFEFRIEIDGYEGEIKHKAANGSDPSHEAKTGYFGGKHHKYSIIANGKTNDPEIVVEP